MDIRKMDIADINPAKYNPRKDLKPGDAEYENLKKSITEFDLVEPLIMNKNGNVLVGGHQRLKILKELGYTETEVSIVDLPPEKEKALNIALNKISGEWDMPKLKDILEELDDGSFDIEMTGFDVSEIEDIVLQFNEPGEIVEDEVPEPPEEPITKPGDLWILGRHRLLCGDSTIITDVERLMDGKKADMCFTDPPYLMGFTGNVHADGSKSFNAKHGEILNDKMTRAEGDAFICSIFSMIKGYVVGAWYVCFYRLGLGYLYKAIDVLGMKHHALIVWDKGNHTLSGSDYMSKYEPIMYGWVSEHKFYGERGSYDIWTIPRTAKNELHPTMKPVSLCATGIKNSSEQDGVVLDLFGGSGTTLVASEQLNRICYMMELDPKYCDVIVQRWENLTGQKAELSR